MRIYLKLLCVDDVAVDVVSRVNNTIKYYFWSDRPPSNKHKFSHVSCTSENNIQLYFLCIF